MMRRRNVLPLLTGGLLGILSGRQGHAAIPAGDVYSVLGRNDDLSRWKDMVDRAGLAVLLQGPGPFTVFAVTDYALSVGRDLSIPPRGVQMAPNLRRRIRLLVEAHIVEGTHDLAELSASSRTYANLAGGMVSVSRNSANITVSWESAVSAAEGTLTSAPTVARNGLVYAIGPLVSQPFRP